MWFVGTGRAGAAHADGVAARLRKAESDERSCQDVLGDYDRAHRELEERVERLEAELAEARRQKLEAFARWWNCREDRDRARHVARRLRRRLKRIHRREAARGRAGAVDVPAPAEGPDRLERSDAAGRPDHPDSAGYPDFADRPDRPGRSVRWADAGTGPDTRLGGGHAAASENGGNGHRAGRHRANSDENGGADNGGAGSDAGNSGTGSGADKGGAHPHPADGRRAGGPGPIPSQREGGEDTGESGGSGGVGGDRERQHPRVGWKRANGSRRRPRE
ncbi:hypothetical protein O4J56_10635 [Nocardiopsis sp. RSe5-2]|uniref:Uncharacterized protein n=1 Tax=Nocardiopsis endophytica TaxID=3018445 RepID=A0ABT4U2C3_9ACTN|nr:hypothetical protein [Nocardiopsis endophytica]MDA2811093.1 hypothetical protein [Nocardiopsis endophytica]